MGGGGMGEIQGEGGEAYRLVTCQFSTWMFWNHSRHVKNFTPQRWQGSGTSTSEKLFHVFAMGLKKKKKKKR